MITLGIDPGLKPGVVVLDSTGRLTHAHHTLEHIDAWALAYGVSGAWPLVVTEGQRIYPNSDVDANDIITLAFRAGFTLASIPALRRMRIPPQVWRGNTSANKAVIQNRILRTLTPEERALFKSIPKSRHGDVLDSIGITRKGQRLASEGNSTYDYA
jgi:hypothetical protein